MKNVISDIQNAPFFTLFKTPFLGYNNVIFISLTARVL